jgi:hypothetical protein
MTMVGGRDAVRTAVTAAQQHGQDRARMLRPHRGEAVTGRVGPQAEAVRVQRPTIAVSHVDRHLVGRARPGHQQSAGEGRRTRSTSAGISGTGRRHLQFMAELETNDDTERPNSPANSA